MSRPGPAPRDRRPAGHRLLLDNLGIAALQLSDYARARALLEESLVLWRELDDAWGIASTLANLGVVAERSGDYARATALHEEGRSARQLGDKQDLTVNMSNMAIALPGTTCGPKVRSIATGPQVPAWIGPETNSQNGSKFWKAARPGS